MSKKTKGSGVRHAFGIVLILFGICAVAFAAAALMYASGNGAFSNLNGWFKENFDMPVAKLNLMAITEGVIGFGIFVVGLVFALTNNKPKTVGAIENDAATLAERINAPQATAMLAVGEDTELSGKARKNRQNDVKNLKRNYQLAKNVKPATAPAGQPAVDDGQMPAYGETVTADGEVIRFIPVQEAFEGIDMGKVQSIEDKFAEIAKMDKTQFVVYVARLFSMQGYQVKLTPVMDNKGVDMVIEKSGRYIAVGCVLTDRLLTSDDVAVIAEGARFYPVSNTIALTNACFDASAVGFAKAHAISLVDHDVLAADFMVK